jgi:hypothetical protein
VQDAATTSHSPGELYSGVQVYTFVPNGNVSNVRFEYAEPQGVSIDHIVPQGNYSGNVSGGTACKLTVYYKESLNSDLENTNRNTGHKVKLYAIYNSSSDNTGSDKKLELNVSLQDCACCDGLLLENGAWDYANGAAGDWAVGKTVPNSPTTQQNGDITVTTDMHGNHDANYSKLTNYFKNTSSGALCWYKKNPDAGETQNWVSAINNCTNGTYADGDNTADWYLPNLKEWDYLYRYLPGTDGQSKLGTKEIFGGGTGAAALANGYYWTSTESGANTRYRMVVGNGSRDYSGGNNDASRVRCVRRL